MADDSWPGEWMRGVLALCVLRVVDAGPTYGYAIATSLADAGLGRIKGGTLYPLLNRFEYAGLVQVEWRPGDGGPGRKYYTLTDAGRRELTDGADQWIAFAAVTTRLVVPQPAMTSSPSNPAGSGAGKADPS